MTDDQIRIAMAQALGWKFHDDGMCVWWTHPTKGEMMPLPDYPNDLNAVHEAETQLQHECKYWPDYIDELAKLFPFDPPNQKETNWSQMVHATAHQRCEAFLRVKGLWTE